MIRQDKFYKRLISHRAKYNGGFINDRGYRHIKNRDDNIGSTYAFWLIR